MKTKTRLASATLGLTIITQSNAVVMFSDGDFPSDIWTDIDFVFDDPRVSSAAPLASTSSVARRATGGNPEAFRESTINWVFGDAILSGGLNLVAVYDPNAQGAIASIDANLDVFANLFEPLDTNGNPVDLTGTPTLGWSVFIEQDGIRYRSVDQQATSSSEWLTLPILDLRAADFGSDEFPGSAPDFSSLGAPITFGYILGHGSVPENEGTPPLIIVHGADNWAVTINQVISSIPEPATLALISTGLTAFGWMRGRKKSII